MSSTIPVYPNIPVLTPSFFRLTTFRFNFTTRFLLSGLFVLSPKPDLSVPLPTTQNPSLFLVSREGGVDPPISYLIRPLFLSPHL